MSQYDVNASAEATSEEDLRKHSDMASTLGYIRLRLKRAHNTFPAIQINEVGLSELAGLIRWVEGRQQAAAAEIKRARTPDA